MREKAQQTDVWYDYDFKCSRYAILLPGGSVIIYDRMTGECINRIKGHHYLYSGGFKPDEAEFFVLENGKHFYVYSAEKHELLHKVTFPRFYWALDVNGFYSGDGSLLFVPVKRMDDHYEYRLLKYETENYSLIDSVIIGQQEQRLIYERRLPVNKWPQESLGPLGIT